MSVQDYIVLLQSEHKSERVAEVFVKASSASHPIVSLLPMPSTVTAHLLSSFWPHTAWIFPSERQEHPGKLGIALRKDKSKS